MGALIDFLIALQCKRSHLLDTKHPKFFESSTPLLNLMRKIDLSDRFWVHGKFEALYLIHSDASERLFVRSSRNVQHLLIRSVRVASLNTLRIAPKHAETNRETTCKLTSVLAFGCIVSPYRKRSQFHKQFYNEIFLESSVRIFCLKHD